LASRSTIAVGHAALGRFIREALVAKGASTSDAETVAEGLVWANLRGIDGHGVSRLPLYLAMIASGEIDPKARAELVHDGAATFLVEGHHGFGPPAMMQAIATATERARTTGIAFGLVRETTHTGAIGRYAQWMAERGCAGIIVAAGPSFMAYHGARVPSLATSPIAIAVPRGGGTMVLDMATSAISNGKLLQARATGAPLPAGAVLNEAGEPTTDPHQAATLLPLGGAKGSGLGFMIEMLASVLAAAPIQSRALGPEKRTRRTQNSAIFAIDIAAFRPLAAFAHDADALAVLIKALPRQAGFDEILMPGERSDRTEAARRKSGIPIPAKLWEELAKIAEACAIKMPEPVPPST